MRPCASYGCEGVTTRGLRKVLGSEFCIECVLRMNRERKEQPMTGISPGRMMELAHQAAATIYEMDREPDRELALIRMETKIYGAIRTAVREAEAPPSIVQEQASE